MGFGDSLEITLRVPEGEEALLSALDAIADEEAKMTDMDDLRAEKEDRGWAVYEGDVEAPVTIRNTTFFKTKAEAEEALAFYAEARV